MMCTSQQRMSLNCDVDVGFNDDLMVTTKEAKKFLDLQIFVCFFFNLIFTQQ